MGRVKTIARRSFLIGSAAVVGGVAFGFYKYVAQAGNPLLADLNPGEAALTPYVRIDQNGITIITPRADMGQGSHSILAALVAEELDIAWQDIRIDPGVPSPAYYNGVVAADALPIAATSDSILAQTGRASGHVISRFVGLQITGGSSTVADAYEKMRMAGATARVALLQAAALQSGKAVARLTTKDGHVILPDGTTLSYTSLAPLVAGIPLPTDVALKPEAKWRFLGKPMPRLDMVSKSTGTAIYGPDIQRPDMVFATVRTTPRMGGTMLSYDASEAKSARGVLQILPVTGGVGVIADNTWRAFQAAALIDVDWGPAPYPAEQKAHWAAVAAAFTKEHKDSRFKNDGNIETALGDATTIAADYRVPYLAHAPLEPINATVQLTDQRLDIWTGTQIPMFMRLKLEKLTGLSGDNIHIHNQIMGGSFGRRLEDDYVVQAVELAQAMPGTPVKMTWSREEDMTHGFPRPLAMGRGRGAVNAGRVIAFDLDIAAPSVTASQSGRMGLPAIGPDVVITAGAWDQPYAIPNYRVTGYRVPPLLGVSSWRSVGASGNGFLHECFLDELIHAAGADPLHERLRLCWHDPSRKVLEAVGEMSHWGSPMGKAQGRGIAFTLSFGVPVAEVVEVTQTDDGIRIDKVFVAADVGKILDPVNFENQVTGGVIWGLGHAMMGEITYSDGMVEQDNFHAFEAMRLYQTPAISVRGLENGDQIRGIGEPPVPPAAPALANAIFAATGQRIRELPLRNHIDFI